MRLLFTMDKKDYDKCTKEFIRNSARGIIIENNKVAMIHSLKYDYYKFPGGGIEKGESIIDALIRETEEEAGLEVIKDTIREYGYVHRIQKATMTMMKSIFRITIIIYVVWKISELNRNLMIMKLKKDTAWNLLIL